MAAIASAAAGVWSATGTWVGGVVPLVDVDTVVITHTVTVDATCGAGVDTTTAAIDVQTGGKLEVLSTVAANVTLTCAGDLKTTGTGIIEFGTVANPIPNTRTLTVLLNKSASPADGKYGMLINTGGSTLRIQGASMTFDRTLLAADASAAATSLTTADSTGWKNGDVIGLAPTTRTSTQFESKALTADASGTTLTITAITNARSGTSPTQATLINLTRNIVIKSYTSTAMAYVYITTTPTVDIDWTEFAYVGENATSKRGIDINVTSGSCSINRCSIHDCEDYGVWIAGGTTNNITFTNNVMYNLFNAGGVAAGGFHLAAATSGTSITVTGNVVIGSGYHGFNSADLGLTFTDNLAAGCLQAGFNLQEGGAIATGTIGALTAHTNSVGIVWNAGDRGLVSGMTVWRNSAGGLQFGSNAGYGNTFADLVAFGNAVYNVGPQGGWDNVLTSPILSGDSTFGTPRGIVWSLSGPGMLRVFNGDFGTASGIKVAHSTEDIGVTSGQGIIHCHNCKFASTTEITVSVVNTVACVSSQKHDQTAGLHKIVTGVGTIIIETTTVDVSPSAKATPTSATLKLEILRGTWRVPVASGATITSSIKVRKNTTYNGNPPRLLVKRNVAAGISADTVLDTFSVGADTWETLTGTTAAVTDDAVLEFVVDCDGTAGSIFVDTASHT